MVWKSWDEFTADFRAEIDFCAKFLYMTRGKEFQEEAAARLEAFLPKVRAMKAKAIEQTNEEYANSFLYHELVCGAFLGFLKMWLALKADKMGEAFDYLVGAENATGYAITLRDGEQLQNLKQRLQVLEDILFPAQQFVSSAHSYRDLTCSICGSEYGTCGHIRGRPYMGQLCESIVGELIHVDHVAIVEDPADKTCRLPSLFAEGCMRDWMTWMPTEEAEATAETASDEQAPLNATDRDAFTAWIAKAMSSCQKFFFFTGAKSLQEQAVERLKSLIERIHAVKAEAIEAEDEEWANALLAYQCLGKVFLQFILTWVKVKNDEMDEAWTCLISAQDHLRSVARMHWTESAQNVNQWLHILEAFVFPSQQFNSVGITVLEQRCSICNQEYGSCGHIKGRVYMGRMCSRIIEKWALREISLVDDPNNKHCRMTSFHLNGESRNWMTWRLLPDESETTDETALPAGAGVFDAAGDDD